MPKYEIEITKAENGRYEAQLYKTGWFLFFKEWKYLTLARGDTKDLAVERVIKKHREQKQEEKTKKDTKTIINLDKI